LSINVPTSWQWTFSGGNPSSSTVKNPGPICYDTPGTYPVSLIVSNAQGTAPIFTKTDYIKVNVTPPDLTYTITDTLGKLVYLDAINNGNNYNWSPGIGISSTIDKIVSHYIVDSYKVYTCVVTNDKGCQGTTTYQIYGNNAQVINIGNLIWVPNAFSPNGDTKNDRLVIKHNNLDTYECAIYNRWGQKVFATNNPDNSWNGTTGGTDIGTQVFFYQIKVKFKDGSEKFLKGDITVLY
jgi:gliding motility-associated-like protein